MRKFEPSARKFRSLGHAVQAVRTVPDLNESSNGSDGHVLAAKILEDPECMFGISRKGKLDTFNCCHATAAIESQGVMRPPKNCKHGEEHGGWNVLRQ
jgi:hypothetical protein